MTTNQRRFQVPDDNCIKYENESNEKPTITEYLENIRPYLRDMSEDLKTIDQ